MSSEDTDVLGSVIIARNLSKLGVEYIFGIVGIPVIEVAQACIDIGIRFISFRNEQSAAYAAAAYGYLSGRPGVCLVVGGPGVIHSMAGVHHAESNGWPFMLLAGSSETYQRDMGAFQELDQVGLLKPHVKYAGRPPSLALLPRSLERAFRQSFYGRPGPTYVDLPADLIMAHARSTEYVPCVRPPDSPCSLAAQPDVARAAALLRMAKRPLVIIGKGAQFARAESAVQRLLSVLPIPFIPTPMGKGLIPDDHPLCVAAARSTALAQADVVLILGARLNWILHYGQHPKWNEHAKFIRVEIDPSTIDNNKAAEVNLLGDLNGITNQLAHALESHPCESLQATVHSLGNMSQDHALWYKFLFAKCHENAQKMIEKTMILQTRGQKTDRRGFEPRMTYQQAFNIIRKELPADHIFIGEGANTMDIARSMFDVVLPRSRLDAGTQATMGVGMGYCIAAALDAASYSRSSGRPRRPIVAIIGDSAFGFSAMEVETAVRNRMGMLVIVMNNGGVYKGLPTEIYSNIDVGQLPPTALQPEIAYDALAVSLGGEGIRVTTGHELKTAVIRGIAAQKRGTVTLVNVLMDSGMKKELKFGWLASTKTKSKL